MKLTKLKMNASKQNEQLAKLLTLSLKRGVSIPELLKSSKEDLTKVRIQAITKAAQSFFKQNFTNPDSHQSDEVQKTISEYMTALYKQMFEPKITEISGSREIVIHRLGYQENPDGTQTERLF